MNEIFAESIDKATKEVMQMMAGLNLTAGAPETMGEPKQLGAVTVSIGFSGSTFQAVMMLHYSQDLVFAVAEAMFGEPATDLTEEVLDAVGEMTNMICGNVKTNVVNSGQSEFNISIPTVIVGSNYRTVIQIKVPSMLYPFATPDGNKMFIELKLKLL